jgi:SAM-dependent methyltransferase
MWDTRYSNQNYVYGTAPNDFLRLSAYRIPKGQVLSLAEGEGRNAVYLASQGYDVTCVDSSAVGLEKARRLASERSVNIATIVADLAEYRIEPNSWDGIVSIFCHLPSTLRAEVHRRIVTGLRPGGCLLLEAYTPRQLDFKTGGPQNPDNMPDLENLRRELMGLRFEHAVELERDVLEGEGHFGRGAVVQILAFKDV